MSMLENHPIAAALVARIDRLSPTPNQRERWLANAALTEAWLDVIEHSPGVTSPIGLLETRVGAGVFPVVQSEQGRSPLAELLTIWVRNEGRYYPLEIVRDEISAREIKRGQVLTQAEHESVVAYWHTFTHTESPRPVAPFSEDAATGSVGRCAGCGVKRDSYEQGTFGLCVECAKAQPVP